MKIDKLCDYCGEENTQVTIPNPNFDEDNFWDVCVTCNKVIKEQMNLSFGVILSGRDSPVAKRMSDKIVNDSSKKIRELAYESGKMVCSVGIDYSPKTTKETPQ